MQSLIGQCWFISTGEGLKLVLPGAQSLLHYSLYSSWCSNMFANKYFLNQIISTFLLKFNKSKPKNLMSRLLYLTFAFNVLFWQNVEAKCTLGKENMKKHTQTSLKHSKIMMNQEVQGNAQASLKKIVSWWPLGVRKFQ